MKFFILYFLAPTTELQSTRGKRPRFVNTSQLQNAHEHKTNGGREAQTQAQQKDAQRRQTEPRELPGVPTEWIE